MTLYRTKEGDILDVICLRFYGRATGCVEAVLEANPGLAEQGTVLIASTVIELPEMSSPVSSKKTIRLWE